MDKNVNLFDHKLHEWEIQYSGIGIYTNNKQTFIYSFDSQDEENENSLSDYLELMETAWI